MTSALGPQWTQLPMLMTPDEVRNAHSHSWNDKMANVEEDWGEHSKDAQKVNDLKARFRVSPPRGDQPVIMHHNDPEAADAVGPHAGPGFGDGHHRAIAAAQLGHLTPVVHTTSFASYEDEMDRQKEKTLADPSWTRGWEHW